MEARLNDFAMFISETDELNGVGLRDAKKRELLNPISIVYDAATSIKLSPEGTGDQIDCSRATVKGKDDM